jgi:eukaryotic-like serine/threonine-protein kinase
VAQKRLSLSLYAAASEAVRAAAGQGPEKERLGGPEQAGKRRQALAWLRADLALWQKQAASGKAEDRAAARQALRRWQEGADLAGVRGKEALAKLPAEERAEWEKLWAEVADILRRLDSAKAAAGPAGK